MSGIAHAVRPGFLSPAHAVFLAGVAAAFHIGKLPPAVPVLRDALGVTLVQAGFLLSLVQLAGMSVGVVVGLAVDSLGLKRSMVGGLLILSGAGALGGWAREPGTLLALRAVEGFGFLFATVPGPSLLRLLVPPERLSMMLGVWSTYMPLGVALALLAGPLFIAAAGWEAWWWTLAALSALAALALWHVVPAGVALPARSGHSQDGDGRGFDATAWAQRLRLTLTAAGPWLVALSFALYASQWLAVIGFLPAIYIQAGISGGTTGVLTALAAGANIVGNLASGALLHRGVAAHRLLQASFAVMALGAVGAFAEVGGSGLPWTLRYAAVLLFSAVGGVVPGTLFSLAVRLAPGERTVATTVGWMQQWSSFGQFASPPLVAWVASAAGGWQWTWTVTGACSLFAAVLAGCIGRVERGRR